MRDDPQPQHSLTTGQIGATLALYGIAGSFFGGLIGGLTGFMIGLIIDLLHRYDFQMILTAAGIAALIGGGIGAVIGCAMVVVTVVTYDPNDTVFTPQETDGYQWWEPW